MKKLIRYLADVTGVTSQIKNEVADNLHGVSVFFGKMQDVKEAFKKSAVYLRSYGYINPYEVRDHVEEVKAERDFNE